MRLKHFVMLCFVSISFNHFLYLILWPNTAGDIFRRFGHFFTFFFLRFFYFDLYNLVAVRCCDGERYIAVAASISHAALVHAAIYSDDT